MRLRFSIRDLLWLTVVVAMGLGWWLDHRATMSRLDELEAEYGKLLQGTTVGATLPPNNFPPH